MKRLLLPLLLAVCAGALIFTLTAQPQDNSPKLVLVISVDQMRFDYLTRFQPLFHGGFARLLKDGAVFTHAFYRHATTETGPGHAVILTGKHGAHSGIVSNEWYDSYLKKDINVVDDPLRLPVGGSGRAGSPGNMNSFTVGDVLKKSSPDSRVMTVSLKDRSAILLGGKLADAAYWYDTATGHYMTSTYYASRLPEWLEKWNATPYPNAYAGKQWTRLKDDAALYEKYAGPDAVQGEWDGKDIVFPHLVRGAPPSADFYSEFRRLPFADEMTLQVALQMIRNNRLGSGKAIDLVAVSFSATDIIGHTYGPDSQEILDQLLRLDMTLDQLFKEVDASVGLSRTLIVLTADHGVMPLVEVLNGRGIPAKRVNPEDIEKAVRDALAQKYPGASDIIAEAYTPSFYLNEEAIAARKLSLRDVEETIRQALLATGAVEAVYTASDFAAGPRPEDPVFQLYRNAYFAPRSPQVIGAPKEYLYIDNSPGGTGHGTHHDYDRHVPILFSGAAIQAGTYDQPCGPEDIAPTLAAILKLDFPREPDARVLTEMLRNKP